MGRGIQVGDTVAYSQAFGRSVGLGRDAMNARGKVTELHTFGRGSTTVLAVVDWYGVDLPTKVNVANLARPGTVKFAG